MRDRTRPQHISRQASWPFAYVAVGLVLVNMLRLPWTAKLSTILRGTCLFEGPGMQHFLWWQIGELSDRMETSPDNSRFWSEQSPQNWHQWFVGVHLKGLDKAWHWVLLTEPYPTMTGRVPQILICRFWGSGFTHYLCEELDSKLGSLLWSCVSQREKLASAGINLWCIKHSLFL